MDKSNETLKLLNELLRLTEEYKPLIREDNDFYSSEAQNLRNRLQKIYYQTEGVINKICGGVPMVSLFGTPYHIFETSYSEANSTAAFHTIKHVSQILNKVITQLPSSSTEIPTNSKKIYIHQEIIEKFSHKQDGFNYNKLIELCKELNFNFSNDKPYATLNLIRSIIDHVPPLLGFTTFEEIANNYSWKTSTDKNYIHALAEHKLISHDSLHRPISNQPDLIKMDIVPNKIYLLTLLNECLKRNMSPDTLKNKSVVTKPTTQKRQSLNPDSPIITASLNSVSSGPEGVRVEISLQNIGKSIATPIELILGDITQSLTQYQPLTPNSGPIRRAINVTGSELTSGKIPNPTLTIKYKNALSKETYITIYKILLEPKADGKFSIQNFIDPEIEYG